jgi:hypothetical protein
MQSSLSTPSAEDALYWKKCAVRWSSTQYLGRPLRAGSARKVLRVLRVQRVQRVLRVLRVLEVQRATQLLELAELAKLIILR